MNDVWEDKAQDVEPNQIETLYTVRLMKLMSKCNKLISMAEEARTKQDEECWLAMVRQIPDIQGLYHKLHVMEIDLNCRLTGRNFHEGVDG